MKRVAAVTRPKSGPDQPEDMFLRLLAAVAATAPVPALVPEVPAVEKLLQRLVAETQSRPPPVVSPPEPVGLEKLLRSYLSGQQPVRPPTRQRTIRRDWNGVVCFSCGKSGHAANHCPALDESFPFMLPGWRAESTPGGFVMISPLGGDGESSHGKRRLIRGRGSPPGSVVMFDPRIPAEGHRQLLLPDG